MFLIRVNAFVSVKGMSVWGFLVTEAKTCPQILATFSLTMLGTAEVTFSLILFLVFSYDTENSCWLGKTLLGSAFLKNLSGVLEFLLSLISSTHFNNNFFLKKYTNNY